MLSCRSAHIRAFTPERAALLMLQTGYGTIQFHGNLSPSTAKVGADHRDLRCGVVLGQAQQRSLGPACMVGLTPSGDDVANDRLIPALASAYGRQRVMVDASCSGHFEGLTAFQGIDGLLCPQTGFDLGNFDSTPLVQTSAGDGVVAGGAAHPLTASRRSRILELDGRPAWSSDQQRLDLSSEASERATIPIAVLAEGLRMEQAAFCCNSPTLGMRTQAIDAGERVDSSQSAKGTWLLLTIRGEERIEQDLDRWLLEWQSRHPGSQTEALDQTDVRRPGCRLFNHAISDERLDVMQPLLCQGDVLPPWYGMDRSVESGWLDDCEADHKFPIAQAAPTRSAAGSD